MDPADITQLLSQQIKEEDPGIAVGIVRNGQLVYEHHLGYANLDHQVPVDAQTRFNIASNAKQFTALCILRLIEKGQISLEDDIRTYFPDLYPQIEEPITISQLLAHTSGVRDYCDLLALTGNTWWRQFVDNGDVMEMMRKQTDLNFPPGTEFLYSNSNYILLAEIVQQVSGQAFHEFAKAQFEALDMPNTAFQTHYGEIIPHRARPYGQWNVWRDEPTITEVHGDGALYTTLRDQLRWEQVLQANDGSYLSQQLINQSQAPLQGSYGYGVEFRDLSGWAYTFHDGVTGAYRATFLRFPSQQLSIVVMSNNRNVQANNLAWEIAALVGELPENQANAPYPGNPETVETLTQIQEVVGSYQQEDGTIIRITERDGFLYRELYQREPVKLIPEQGGLFEYETIKDLKMNFTGVGTSEQQFTLYLSSQPPNTYRKLSQAEEGTFDKAALNGRFYNAETDTEIILKFVEGDTYSLTKNGRERQAKLIVADYLRMMDTYKIHVIRDEANEVVGLNVDRDRIRNVIFKRS
ncbi:MAG: serine hydrolase domain-containing protein [Bacteroidota bacterium]